MFLCISQYLAAKSWHRVLLKDCVQEYGYGEEKSAREIKHQRTSNGKKPLPLLGLKEQGD